MAFKPSSLQRVFIIPFVLLMLCLAATISWVLYRAGEDATAATAGKAVFDLHNRIAHVIDHNRLQAETTLKAIAPDAVTSADGVARNVPFPEQLDGLEDRLWLATGLFPEVTRYAYFGSADGRFIGVNRIHQDAFELRLREGAGRERNVYRMSAPHLPGRLLRSEQYEARERPWYREAVTRGRTNWSSLYTDFTTRETLLTLSKPMYRDDKSLIGVVSTDMPLGGVAAALRTLPVSPGAVAFVAERDGGLIATSGNELPHALDKGILMHLHAQDSGLPLVRAAYAETIRRLKQDGDPRETLQVVFDTPTHDRMALSASVIRDSAGLDWIVVAAAPHADFRGKVTGTIYQSLAIGLVAVMLALCLGFLILRWVLRDIRKLTLAAKRIGSGEPFHMLDIDRRDEIGQLAESFRDMEQNLRTDRLTHLLNRDSLAAQIEFRSRSATLSSPLRFALLFIDLDNFKQINDNFGHDCGDAALIEVAARLQRAVRSVDAVARFGGDEFVVYLDGVTRMAAAEAICEDIRAILAEPVMLPDGASSIVGASMGVALYPEDGRDTEALLRVADSRMYASKRQFKIPT